MQSSGARSPRGGLGTEFDSVIAAARAGQPAAWERLYAALAPAVTGYLRVQGATEPDDLASEVFLGVFRGIGSFAGDEAGFRSWVFVIAHRRLQDERRQRARRPQPVSFEAGNSGNSGTDGRGGSVAGSAEDEALRELATDRVRTVCRQLVPDQRDVVLLRVLGDLTVEQVGAVLDKTPGAVKQLQRRGLEAIRRISTAAPADGAPDFERQGVPL